MPSAPYDLSSWKICLVATPLAFHTTQVSTVVAAHWMSPDATGRWRSFGGILVSVTSRPCFLNRPASLARVRGAKPVQPLMPTATLVSCAAACVIKSAASAAPQNADFIVLPRRVAGSWLARRVPASQDLEHRLGRAAERRLVAADHDRALDRDRVRDHALDQLVVR